MAAKTEKGSEVKDFTTDPVDSDKVLGFKNSDGTRWWSLSRFWNWIKSKTASTITAGDKTPVNSDAVNGALTNYANVINTEDLNTLVPNADGKPIMWYSPSGNPANKPAQFNVWSGIAYNLWGYTTQIAYCLGGNQFIRNSWTDDSGVHWNDWKEIALKSDFKTQSIIGVVDSNGNISLTDIQLPKRIISVYSFFNMFIPFVYSDYWVLYCMDVGGNRTATGTEINATIVYYE